MGRMWLRATGGGDVAAEPGDTNDELPEVRPAPGVREVCDWLRAAGDRAPESEQRFAFLVGGPGAGKSYALSRVVAGLDECDPSDSGLAQRTYAFRLDGRELTVVNDATIKSADHSTHPLVDDMSSAIQQGSHMFVCVNRGVLVEEANLVSPDAGAAELLLHWLLRSCPLSSPGDTSGVALEVHGANESVTTATLTASGATIRLAVVFVDVCSLFEARPSVLLEVGPGGEVLPHGEKYQIARAIERHELDDRITPAGELLAAVSDMVKPPASHSSVHNPLVANAESLASHQVRSGVLALLRATEVVTGMRLTFREIWGAFARLLVGDLPSQIRSESLAVHIEGLAPGSSTGAMKFEAMRKLASLRFSEALFSGSSPQDPVVRLTRRIDPVFDALPGRLRRDDSASGWSTPVLDAFSGLVTAASPLETMEGLVPADDAFRAVITDFDRELDRSFLEATGHGAMSEKARGEAVAWYGAYLTRLYGVSNGIPAYRHEVALWTDAWTFAPAVPSGLKASLLTLLRPRRDPKDPSSSLLLPVFDSRTTPIAGSVTSPRLAVRGADVALRSRRDGDHVFLEMSEGGKPIGSIELDYQLVRSAMSCMHGHLGITESSAKASPRIERFRAESLVASRLFDDSNEFVVLDADGEEGLVVVK